VKKMLQNLKQKNSDQKTLEAGSIGSAPPTPAGCSLDEPPRINLCLADWRRQTRRLRAEESFHNAWRGLPEGWRFDRFYRDGHSPMDALTAWRDWQPWEDD